MFLLAAYTTIILSKLFDVKRVKKHVKTMWKMPILMSLTPLCFAISPDHDLDTGDLANKTLDIVKLPIWASSTSDNHKKAIVKRALEVTVDDFGDYKIIQDTPRMNRNRSLQSIQEGIATNLHIIPKTPGWDEKTIPIKIPIRRGILSYRLILTTKNNVDMFHDVKTLDQIKKLRVGVNKDSSTIHVLEDAHFNIVPTDTFSSLHAMLKNHRMDYLLRGPHEIFDEGERTKENYKDFKIVSDIAVYSPLPTYAYVSPKHPKLAKRIKAGLQIMQRNGDLKKLFYYYFSEFLEKSNLRNRHLIHLENKSVSKSYLKKHEAYWYTQNEEPHKFSELFNYDKP